MCCIAVVWIATAAVKFSCRQCKSVDVPLHLACTAAYPAYSPPPRGSVREKAVMVDVIFLYPLEADPLTVRWYGTRGVFSIAYLFQPGSRSSMIHSRSKSRGSRTRSTARNATIDTVIYQSHPLSCVCTKMKSMGHSSGLSSGSPVVKYECPPELTAHATARLPRIPKAIHL